MSFLSFSQEDRSSAPPTANFTYDVDRICPNQIVNFVDKSIDHDSTYFWYFEGGIPNFSTEEFPTITYPNEGSFKVSLTVYNNNGSSKVTKLNLIQVQFPEQITLDVTEDFEDFNETNWHILNPDGGITWEVDTLVGAYDMSFQSLSINNYFYNSNGSEDYLVSDPISFDGLNGPILSFDYAYIPYFDQYFDTLAIYYSNDCGNTKTLIWKNGGDSLATADSSQFAFIPTAEEWDNITLHLSDYNLNDTENVSFYIGNINYYGNNLYIDNIIITDPTSVNQVENIQFELYPNPASSILNINGLGLFQMDKVFILNSLGQTILIPNVSNKINIENLNPGMYYLNIRLSNGQIVSKAFVKE